jgi:hypothetical protein
VPRPGFCSALLLCTGAWTFSIHAAADSSARTPGDPGGPPAGFHDVKVAGGAVVRVSDEVGPHYHGQSPVSDDGKYDPENADFSLTSSMATKSFNVGAASLTQSETAKEASDSKHFLTQPYSTSSYGGAGRSFETVAYNDSAHPDAGLNKSFTLPSVASEGGQSFNTGGKSPYQGKTALIAQTTPKIDPFSAPGLLTEKTFTDPVMAKVPHVKRDLYASRENLDVARMIQLPNRALTVDEVRDLINHEQTPDLTSKPDPASKPLNDPNWTPPEMLPPAADDHPSKPGPTTEDKGDDLPSPGMMAQPPSPASR